MSKVMWGWNQSKEREYPILLDPFNSYPVVQDAEHAAIHAQVHYHLLYGVEDLGAMTTPNDTITLSFKTPTDVYCHMIFAARSEGGPEYRIMEGKTGGGVSPTGYFEPLNSYRPSTNTSGLKDLSGNAGRVSYDATLFTGGTLLRQEWLGSSFDSKSVRGYEEWVLKQDEWYQVALIGTFTDFATLEMTWYEYDQQNYR